MKVKNLTINPINVNNPATEKLRYKNQVSGRDSKILNEIIIFLCLEDRPPQVLVSGPDWILHNPSLVQTISLDSPALEIDINATAYRSAFEASN